MLSQPLPDAALSVGETASASRIWPAVEGLLLDRAAGNRSRRTLQFYREQLRPFCQHLERLRIDDVLGVTANSIRSYLVDLATRRSAGGQHAAYRAIKAFLRWYVSEHEPPGWTNPISKVKPPKRPSGVQPAVALQDIAALMATCRRGTFSGDRDQALILALLDTGCRASELLDLNVGDVDVDTGSVTVLHGKGDKKRTTFLGQNSRTALAVYLSYRNVKPEDPLWITRTGTRLTYAGLRQIMRRRAQRAGIPVPLLHGFRRAFALACLRNGVDLVSLQMLLGHSDLNVVKRYLALAHDDLQRAHSQGSPVDHHRELFRQPSSGA